jgi:chromosome segregation ATPase
MSQTTPAQELEEAIERLDRAIARMEGSVRGLDQRVKTINRTEADTRQLINERARLASDLDKATARLKRLDDGAHEVSRRLVTAMETVRAVLAR